jgi:hypothetical protein
MSRISELLEEAKKEQELINEKTKALAETLKKIEPIFQKEIIASFNNNSGEYTVGVEFALYAKLAVYTVAIDEIYIRSSHEWVCHEGLISEEDLKTLITKLKEFILEKTQIDMQVSVRAAFYSSGSYEL